MVSLCSAPFWSAERAVPPSAYPDAELLFQNSVSSDQTLPHQLLSEYKPLLVDKSGSWELFRSQFLMKNAGEKKIPNFSEKALARNSQEAKHRACAFKASPIYYSVILQTFFFPVHLPTLEAFRAWDCLFFASYPLLDSNLYLEFVGATAVKITGYQYLMVRKTLWWLVITYYSGIQFMNICWFTLETLLTLFDEATMC